MKTTTFTFLVVLALVLPLGYCKRVSANQSRSVLTCDLKADDTVNNSASTYYSCVSTSGAVIPQVMFIVVPNSIPDLSLREGLNSTIILSFQKY